MDERFKMEPIDLNKVLLKNRKVTTDPAREATTDPAFREITAGLSKRILEIIGNDPNVLNLSCCIEGCCVSWCCVKIV